MQIEVSKFITLSTCHVSEKTYEALRWDLISELSVYRKQDSEGIEYGFWVYIPGKLRKQVEDNKYQVIPTDLWNCILFAWSYGCDWLCLDNDGQEVTDVSWLQTFTWD